MPCTTLLVGKNASYDGSTIMARNEDSPNGHFMPKKFIVVNPEDQPKHYKSVSSKFECDLTETPMRYTAEPNAIEDEGIWGEAGINEENVAMSETETITTNPRVMGADPIVTDGIGEEDFLTLVLPYIHSAREGVERLGSLLEKYGTYEQNGIGFQDVDEIWWFESVGGHHWMAKKVPDDAYVVMPNQLGIDAFDFFDAYGEKKEHMCSADMVDFVVKNHLDLGYAEGELVECSDFDARAAFGSHSDSDHVYNTPRAWYMLKTLSPYTYKWEGDDADYTPESDDLPWDMIPEHKVTIEDVKYVLSSYYQGTPYDPYQSHDDQLSKGKYRVIGINRNNFLAITQLRPYMPSEIMAIEWLSAGSNAFNSSTPFYANITKTPEYMANACARVTTKNNYWENRLIGALADAHFAACMPHIERFQLETMSMGHKMISDADEEFLAARPENVQEYLEGVNQKISDYLEEKTDEVLDKVLYSASCQMKNGFARSDN